MTHFSGYAIALHTSSPDLGLAISNFSGDHRQQTWHLGREQSNLMHSLLADFLAPQTWSDLTFLAVVIGPGGFTGTRMGVVMARTISQQLNLPLFGISSLAAIAHRQGDPIVAVQMPAQRGELHTAIYQRHDRELQALYPDTVRSPQDWQALLAQQPATLVQADAAQGDYAQSVLALAYQRWHRGERSDWAEVLPFYGQHPVTKYRHGDSIRPD